MSRSLKNGINTHKLIESAPLSQLLDFISSVEISIPQPARDLAREQLAEPEYVDAIRALLTDVVNQLESDPASVLDNHAQRILTLSEGRGEEPINLVSDNLNDADRNIFDAQPDSLARSLWLYQHHRTLFEDAENLFYANHYRNCGKMYDAFEIDAQPLEVFSWDNIDQEILERQIKNALLLPGRCALSHLLVPEQNAEDIQHMLVVRHGGRLASVPEFVEDNGRKKDIYYRPLNEAILLYTPAEGLIEVFSPIAGIRRQLAACFVESALQLDLSAKPLTLKQYNLSRFLTSLHLNVPDIEGFDLDHAAVVEIHIKPDNVKHRVSLKVTMDDDIEAMAERYFGQNSVIKMATGICKVGIAVRYLPRGKNKHKTFSITLTEPNRCNLRSNRHAEQRDLGNALLSAWGILQPVRTLAREEQMRLMPTLLALYDDASQEVQGQFFESRGMDLNMLREGGYIIRKKLCQTLIIQDDEGEREVECFRSDTPGMVSYSHPVDGHTVDCPASYAELYTIDHQWVQETIIKTLSPGISHRSALKPAVEHLLYLGKVNLGAEAVPCYLARNLKDHKTLAALDAYLRSNRDAGVGIILSIGNQHPLCLGPNVVVALQDYLIGNDSDVRLDFALLAQDFAKQRQLARGGSVVELVESDDGETATLFIPGKDSLFLCGEKQISIFRRLVEAHQKGTPAVKTSVLMMDSEASSPAQAFRKEKWASINGEYMALADGKKGYWMLLA